MACRRSRETAHIRPVSTWLVDRISQDDIAHRGKRHEATQGLLLRDRRALEERKIVPCKRFQQVLFMVADGIRLVAQEQT